MTGFKKPNGKQKQLLLKVQLMFSFRFYCCFTSSLRFSSVTMKGKLQSYSSPVSGLLFTAKTLLYGLNKSHWLNARYLLRWGRCKHLQRRENWRETYIPLWLLTRPIISFTCEDTLFAILIEGMFFFTCEKSRSLLWLARINSFTYEN